MKTPAQGGFTIIEVMLFLAITGLLTVAVFVGASATLGQQRYRDSVNSLKGLIQEQYSQVGSVVNSDTNNPVCTRAGSTINFDEDAEQARGTSECLQMGRFLLVEPTKVTTYNVIGESKTGTMAGGDTATLQNYALAATSPEVTEVAWRARIVKPKTTDDLTTSILILRSPLSGSILTYIQDGDNDPATMVSDANMIQKDLCVDSQGSSSINRRLAVRINAGASSQSAVEVPLEKDNVCD
jgi:type II secretory pathway pseudopilin PulG